MNYEERKEVAQELLNDYEHMGYELNKIHVMEECMSSLLVTDPENGSRLTQEVMIDQYILLEHLQTDFYTKLEKAIREQLTELDIQTVYNGLEETLTAITKEVRPTGYLSPSNSN